MIIAIDPGKTGAIAMLYDDGTAYIEDMPVIGKEISGAVVARIFKEFPPDHIYIEAVNSFGMGRQSAFMFGYGVGTILGVAAALDIPYTKISPARWKKHFNLGRDKDAARAAATRLYPKLADQFTRKKDHGRAEALLLAIWAEENA